MLLWHRFYIIRFPFLALLQFLIIIFIEMLFFSRDLIYTLYTHIILVTLQLHTYICILIYVSKIYLYPSLKHVVYFSLN